MVEMLNGIYIKDFFSDLITRTRVSASWDTAFSQTIKRCHAMTSSYQNPDCMIPNVMSWQFRIVMLSNSDVMIPSHSVMISFRIVMLPSRIVMIPSCIVMIPSRIVMIPSLHRHDTIPHRVNTIPYRHDTMQWRHSSWYQNVTLYCRTLRHDTTAYLSACMTSLNYHAMYHCGS